MKSIYKLSIALFLMPFMVIQAQKPVAKSAPDSLSLSDVINSVINNYPALKKAENELVSANAKIDLTKTAYLPDISFSTSYSRIGPTSSISMPIGGTVHNLQLYPENVYNATFSINENIYDFGKTKNNVAMDEQSREMTKLSVAQLKQRLSMALMANFYTITLLQEAIKIKDEQLKSLNEHLSFVEKRNTSGTS